MGIYVWAEIEGFITWPRHAVSGYSFRLYFPLHFLSVCVLILHPLLLFLPPPPNSCVLRLGFHLLVLSGEAALFHRERAWTQLAPLCHDPAPVQCNDDRSVPDL